MKELSEIWDRIAKSDESAFEEMYLHYFNRFYAYGKKITDHANIIEDAIHDVMMKVWLNRHELPQIKNPPAYYYTSFRNTLFDKLKAQNLIVGDEATQVEEDASTEELIVKEETRLSRVNKLNQSFTSLTPRQLEAVFLRFYHEMSYEDVASVLGITVKATYKLIARSLEKLKSEFISILLILNIIEAFLHIF